VELKTGKRKRSFTALELVDTNDDNDQESEDASEDDTAGSIADGTGNGGPKKKGRPRKRPNRGAQKEGKKQSEAKGMSTAARKITNPSMKALAPKGQQNPGSSKN
jgi:hypothetical protein